jgi:mRNA-degrading endonuclease YafQ of YafQ-DinJ toxin-antitoxin module
MTNIVNVSHAFKRDVKPLAKKHATLRSSIDDLITKLSENAYLGDHYGNGGFRVMYYHLKKSSEGIEILLIAIYDKSERSTIKKNDAVKKLKEILAEHNREQNK